MVYCAHSKTMLRRYTVLQKRSHALLASALLRSECGFTARRFRWAFLFGSFQPDCNPFTYLKGSLRAYKFRGHNYSNSQPYIAAHIERLQRRASWTMWQFYTLGKLPHYLGYAYTSAHSVLGEASRLPRSWPTPSRPSTSGIWRVRRTCAGTPNTFWRPRSF